MSSDQVEFIKSNLDIVHVILRYIPNLKKAGSGWVGLCPFHKEKTPSFHVNQKDQYYKCFGCGAAGDVISFIQNIEKVNFKEALLIAADIANVKLTSIKYDDNKEIKKRLIEANLVTAKFYNYILNAHKLGEKGRQYALKRGLNGEIISKFLLGYAPNTNNSLKHFLLAKGFTEQELVDFGLLINRNGKFKDKFRDRLIQPIFSIKGDVIGFSGRYIGENKNAPKYLNSPETLVYKKNETLYSMYHAIEFIKLAGEVILVEGNIDVLSSHRVGIGNIVASLGTSFTEQQAKLIKRYTNKILICFDTDLAGIKAVIRAIGICERVDLTYRVINLGKYQDADEFINNSKDPRNEWLLLIKNNEDAVSYLLDRFKLGLNLSSIDQKSKYKELAYDVLKLIKNDVALFHYCRNLSLELEVPEQVIINEVIELREKLPKKYDYDDVNLEVLNDLDEPVMSQKSLDVINNKMIDNIYFFQLFVNLLYPPDLEDYPREDFFEDSFFQKLLNFCVDNYEDLNFNEFFSELSSDDDKELFNKFIKFDLLPEIDQIDKQFKKLNKIYWQRYISKRLMQLRKIDDEENLDKVNEEIKRLSKLKVKYSK